MEEDTEKPSSMHFLFMLFDANTQPASQNN